MCYLLSKKSLGAEGKVLVVVLNDRVLVLVLVLKKGLGDSTGFSRWNFPVWWKIILISFVGLMNPKT